MWTNSAFEDWLRKLACVFLGHRWTAWGWTARRTLCYLSRTCGRCGAEEISNVVKTSLG